jgi:hypothetical protein
MPALAPRPPRTYLFCHVHHCFSNGRAVLKVVIYLQLFMSVGMIGLATKSFLRLKGFDKNSQKRRDTDIWWCTYGSMVYGARWCVTSRLPPSHNLRPTLNSLWARSYFFVRHFVSKLTSKNRVASTPIHYNMKDPSKTDGQYIIQIRIS